MASSANPVLTEQNDYAVRWDASASAIEKQGGYAWMADQLLKHGPKKVMDIGCGMGHGLAALLARDGGLNIIGVDEVAGCLQQTEVRLQKSGFGVERIERLRFPNVKDTLHQVEVAAAIPPARKQPITLVQANAATPDVEFLKFGDTQAPLDAMTVWLVGTHQLRLCCVDAVKREIRSAEGYRLMVQNQAYRLADRWLRPDGILNLVDREGQSDVPAEAAKEAAERVQAHQDQAAGTGLEVIGVDSMPYTEAAGATGVKMVDSVGTSGKAPAKYHLRLFSVQVRKR